MSTSSQLKIGSLVYSCDSGLGILAKAFYDNRIVTHPWVIQHQHFYSNTSAWYPNSPNCHIRDLNRSISDVRAYLSKMDIVLFFETPFHWELIPYLRQKGVKTVLLVMYECTPKSLPYQPDYFLCPSLLDLKYFPAERSTFLTIPVDRQRIHWKQRDKALVFVHNAGHGGLNSRNGTGELLDALRYVQSPFKLILRSQKAIPWGVDDPRVDLRIGSVKYEELYQEGDVFIFPEKFNGLSLPLQEAYASGMLIMCGDRFPMNTWLPDDPLIEVSRYKIDQISGRCNSFDSAIINPEHIAEDIDYWYGKDISEYSRRGLLWGIDNSWDNLIRSYLDYFEKVKNS